YLGTVHFLIIYIASLILGNLLSLYFHKDEYHYSAVGARGAVTGVLYSAILLEPSMQLGILFIPLPIPAYVFGILYLLYSIYGMKNQLGNIGHDAHFGGAIGGFVVTLILMPSLFQTDVLMVGLLAIPIVILFVLYKTGNDSLCSTLAISFCARYLRSSPILSSKAFPRRFLATICPDSSRIYVAGIDLILYNFAIGSLK